MLRVRERDRRAALGDAIAKIEYQPALDGLRALAVAAVVAYHGELGWAPGGYLGVDVFFVLSGYLITSLLVAEWAHTSRISLRGFWSRRARRLLPALFVMLAGVVVYASSLAEPGELGRLRGDAFATLGYVANWRYVWSGASYFEQFGVPSPLRHTWSLAIEEQWYLLWPLLVVVLLRVGRGRVRLLGGFAIAGAVVSAALMALLFEPVGDWSRVYYGTDTRVQGLLVGAALAVVLSVRPGVLRAGSGRPVEAAGLVGASVLVWCVWRAGDTAEWMYRGGFLLVALASAAVIASAVRPADAAKGHYSVRAALSVSPLRAVGRVSYGIYLWHWPVDVALTSRRVGFEGPGLFALRTGVTVAAAAVSYLLVERPVRVGRLLHTGRGVRVVVPLVTAATVIAVVVATAGARPVEVAEGLVVSPEGTSQPTATGSGGESGHVGPEPSILLAGDSAAFTLAHEFEPAKWPGADWHFLATLGCGVIRGDTVSGGRTWEQREVCRSWPVQWATWSEVWGVDLAVVQVGAWEVLDVRVDGRRLRVGTPEHARYLAGEIEETIDVLSAGGARVVFLRIPCFGPSPDHARLGRERTDPARVDAVNAVLDSVVETHADIAQVLDPAAWLCPGGRYVEEIDGVRIRHDGVHFEGDGAAAFWAWLAPKAQALAGPRRAPAPG